jgi:hypothetical protein
MCLTTDEKSQKRTFGQPTRLCILVIAFVGFKCHVDFFFLVKNYVGHLNAFVDVVDDDEQVA